MNSSTADTRIAQGQDWVTVLLDASQLTPKVKNKDRETLTPDYEFSHTPPHIPSQIREKRPSETSKDSLSCTELNSLFFPALTVHGSGVELLLVKALNRDVVSSLHI